MLIDFEYMTLSEQFHKLKMFKSNTEVLEELCKIEKRI